MGPKTTRSLAALGAGLLLVGAAGTALAQTPPAGTDWTAPYDKAAAATEVANFHTYGMPTSWANYGASIAAFCAANGFDPCVNEADREAGPDYSSLEEITHFDAEKGNPVATVADIGIQFGPIADQLGVVPPYLPPNADALPAGFKSPTGGWVATFAGVPGFNVNVDALTAKNIAVPTSWADLTKPEYKGLVGIGKIGQSGTATSSFIAMNVAAGGTMDDFAPGIAYGKALLPNIQDVPQGDNAGMEKGEVPIQIKYDFNLIAQATALKEKGINVQTVIPADGSIYAPSALILDKYDTAHMDLAKMLSEWVLTDEGQLAFAKFGARPIRSVPGVGTLVVPADAKTLWLPDELYTKVQTVDLTTKTPPEIGEIWTTEVMGQ